jgi:RNA polymerase sigma-70 factor (ECF subfamily)
MSNGIGAAFSSALTRDVKDDYNDASAKKKLLSPDELSLHIQKCALNNRESQKTIYCSFYGYAMAICDRYSNNRDDSLEIINDGFLKVFREIHHYKPAYTDVINSFKGWLRTIMVYTAVDHFRKNDKYRYMTDLDNGIAQVSAPGEDVVDRMSYKEIMRSIKKLTPGYRTVFNLFVIEGLTHEEISRRLGISVGTSKSNLAKGRKQLQEILLRENWINHRQK